MRHHSRLPGIAAAVLAAAAMAGMCAVGTASAAAPRQTGSAAVSAVNQSHSSTAPKGSANPDTADRSAVAKSATPVGDLAPRAPIGGSSADDAKSGAAHQASAAKAAAKPAQSCTPADFASRSGSALSAYVEASTTDCINTLFSVTGSDAANDLQRSADGDRRRVLPHHAPSYPGDDSTSVWQLVLFLRAGYYVQYYNAADVGAYGPTLATAIDGGLDAFFANSHSRTSPTPTARSWARPSS